MTDNDSERIRDLEKSVTSLHGRITQNSEYLMRDLRLSVADIQESLAEHKEKLNGRLSSLEKWRSYVNGITKGLAVSGAVIAGWFKYGHHLK